MLEKYVINIKVIPLHRFFMVLVFKVMKFLASR